MMALDNFKTKVLFTKTLIFKRGRIKDYLKVYEYDFRQLASDKLIKTDTTKIKGWFLKGVEYYRRKNAVRHVFDWIVYEKKTMEPIGNLMAYGEDLKKLGIEISLNLHPDYWDKGYTEEIFEFIIEYLFHLGYNSISVLFSSANKNTYDILENLGLKLDRVKENAWYNDDVAVDDYFMKISKSNWNFRHFNHKKH